MGPASVFVPSPLALQRPPRWRSPGRGREAARAGSSTAASCVSGRACGASHSPSPLGSSLPLPSPSSPISPRRRREHRSPQAPNLRLTNRQSRWLLVIDPVASPTEGTSQSCSSPGSKNAGRTGPSRLVTGDTWLAPWCGEQDDGTEPKGAPHYSGRRCDRASRLPPAIPLPAQAHEQEGRQCPGPRSPLGHELPSTGLSVPCLPSESRAAQPGDLAQDDAENQNGSSHSVLSDSCPCRPMRQRRRLSRWTGVAAVGIARSRAEEPPPFGVILRRRDRTGIQSGRARGARRPANRHHPRHDASHGPTCPEADPTCLPCVDSIWGNGEPKGGMNAAGG